MSWDVAIIGGGPAGSASAISLRQTFPSLRVLVIEASDYSARRVGEVLPPIARVLLQHLGVQPDLAAEYGVPAQSVACAWGSEELRETNHFYAAKGMGWHLERNRFDALLAIQAELSGAEVMRLIALRSAIRANDAWTLQLSTREQVQARWVIDATGRASVFARMQGGKRISQDLLTAFSCIFSGSGDCEARTVVEATADGWWYTTSLPHGRRITSFLTDADIGRTLRMSDTRQWEKRLAATFHIASLSAGCSPIGKLVVRPAASASLDSVHADGWIAAGDAAAAFDPLSAQGITNALRSGMLASYAVGDALCLNDFLAPSRYAAILRAQRQSYARTYSQQYAREQRWSEYPFWARRQNGSVSHPINSAPAEDAAL